MQTCRLIRAPNLDIEMLMLSRQSYAMLIHVVYPSPSSSFPVFHPVQFPDVSSDHQDVPERKDNGVGMLKEELKENLGRIARSGGWELQGNGLSVSAFASRGVGC